jgi:hypothetical protein
MSTFNGTFEVNACVANSIACSVKSLIEQAIRTCGEKYTFNVDEALEMLKISEVKMVTQKKAEKKAEKKAKAEKKTVIPLPFCGMINESCCLGLIPNHGLYTQCPKARDMTSDIALYCIKCNKEALANENEKPNSGDVRDRLSDNFVPPNKNKLTPYVKIMKKLNLTREQVETAALEQGITLPESCFVVPEKKSAKVEKMQKSRGRPKKDEIFVELNDTDLFSQQVLNQLKEDEDNETTVSSLTDGIKDAEKQEKKPRVKLSQEEKEAKKLAQEAKKQAQEAKKQEREAKKLSKAIEKPLAVVESVQEEPKPVEIIVEPIVEMEQIVEEEPKPVEIIVEPIVEMEQIVEEDEPEKLKKFKFADTLYFKGEKSGMIYDYAVTKQRNEAGLDPIQIGVWNKKDKKIDFVKVEENNEEEEEEEDEYESDDE